MSTDAEILGRDDVNDIDAILAITNTDRDEVIHAVKDNADAIFTWDYEKGKRPALNKLYEKAKTSQWNGETDLPWELEVDQEEFARAIMEHECEGLEEAGIDLRAARHSRSGATRSGCRSPWRTRTGASASSCTASRVRCCARPRSSRPCRGSTRSTTPRPR